MSTSRTGLALKSTALSVATALLASTTSLVPTAHALSPATYNPETDRPPSGGPPRSVVPMEQKTVCATSAVLPDSQFDSIPVNSVFGVEDLHNFATGRGQTVAVIDSGVNRNARLPNLRGGGDYIMNEDGLSDCDHHGTLIAGIIAAQPAQNDDFIGVAPDATILSIRQTSGAFGPENSQDSTGSSTLSTLARAIVHAADEGATVINLSVTACIPASSGANLAELKGALHYAAVEKDVVIVSSAGNVDSTCKRNPPPNPADALDPRGWGQVQTISLPSYVDPFVLSVGGATLDGGQYPNSMNGPWVDVASPAINIVSLDPVTGEQGGLINAEVTREGTIPINGTSFAAAYVSGLAALIRERHPNLTSQQVRNRIMNSATTAAAGTANELGHGIVNPHAALAENVSEAEPVTSLTGSRSVAAEAPERGPDNIPIYIALGMTGLMLLVIVIMFITQWFRHGGADLPSHHRPDREGR